MPAMPAQLTKTLDGSAPPPEDKPYAAAVVQGSSSVDSSSAPVALSLAEAIARAKANSPQFQAALVQLGLAREDRVQARAALLPSVDYNNGFIYTEGNHTLSGRFV